MSDNNWKRARSNEQIEQRVNEILESAAEIFLETPFENVTMLMIAKKAKCARSNLYRYFKTKEEIFLTLFLSDIDKWVKDIISTFTKEESLEIFVKKLREILCRQKRLLKLTPLLSLSLERNTSEEVLRKTKLTLYEQMNKVAPYVQKVIPSLSNEQIYNFFIFHQALVAGAWPMAQYTEMQRKVMDELALYHNKIDFASLYENAILMYLKGVTS